MVVEGTPIGVMSARDYYAAKDQLWPLVAAAYDRLAGRFDRIVLEGAGSPVEINLAEHDLTNLRMARHADAAVVLVADIERGGRLRPARRHLGAARARGPGAGCRVRHQQVPGRRHACSIRAWRYSDARTGVPVLGVLPYPERPADRPGGLARHRRDRDRRRGRSRGPTTSTSRSLACPGLSNFTDFWPLARLPGVRVRYVERGSDLGRPDLSSCPAPRPPSATSTGSAAWAWPTASCALGSRRVRADDPRHLRRVSNARPTDRGPSAASSRAGPRVEGLGLLDVTTRFGPTKARHRSRGRHPDGLPHHGLRDPHGRGRAAGRRPRPGGADPRA